MDTFIFVLGLKGLTWTWTGQLVTDPFNTTFFASLAAEIPLKYLRKISEGEWFVILPRESNVLFNWRCHPVCHMSRQKLTPADNSPVGAGGWVAVPTSGWVSDCQQQWWWTTLFPYGTPHISFAETPLTKKKRTFFFLKKSTITVEQSATNIYLDCSKGFPAFWSSFILWDKITTLVMI